MTREERLAANETVVREVNERIEHLGVQLEVADPLLFTCECADLGCLERVEVTRAEYEEVRGEPTHFIVKAGHDRPEVETVVEKRDGSWIVRKDPGEPERLARERDPRR